MNNKFDELIKTMVQAVICCVVLKKFGLGLAGMVLVCFGLVNKVVAALRQGYCQVAGVSYVIDVWFIGMCMDINGCIWGPLVDCLANGTHVGLVVGGMGKF